MNETDKTYFEQMFKTHTTELTNQFIRHVETISENFDLKIGLIADGHATIRQEMRDIRDELKEDISLLDFKIDTVNNHLSGRTDKFEGRFDKLETKVDTVISDLKITDKKVDAVAIDLKAHRADTEAHGGIYRVKES